VQHARPLRSPTPYEGSRALRYVIFIPADIDPAETVAVCMDYAKTQPGWQSEGVIIGRWTAVVAMLEAGHAQVVIIADRSHLPPDRIPRVVVVEEELLARPPQPASPALRAQRWRRPRTMQ